MVPFNLEIYNYFQYWNC